MGTMSRIRMPKFLYFIMIGPHHNLFSVPSLKNIKILYTVLVQWFIHESYSVNVKHALRKHAHAAPHFNIAKIYSKLKYVRRYSIKIEQINNVFHISATKCYSVSHQGANYLMFYFL